MYTPYSTLFALDSVKIGLYWLILAVAIMTAHVAYRGYSLATTPAPRYDPFVLETHQQGVKGLLWLMALLIGCIEGTVRMYHLPHSALFFAHLPFALVWLATFVAMKVRYTGIDYPNLHTYLAYVGLVCGLVAGVLGTVMVVVA